MAGSLSGYEGGTYVLDLLTGNWTRNDYGGTWDYSYNANLGVWQNQLTAPWTWRASTVGQTTTGTLPRLFAAEAGGVRVRELETLAGDGSYSDTHPVTGVWLSHPFDCGEPTREKRLIHLQAVLAAKAGTTWSGSGQLDLYIDGSSTSAQTILFPLVPYAPGANQAKVFSRVVGAARAVEFQIKLTVGTAMTDLQVVGIGTTYITST